VLGYVLDMPDQINIGEDGIYRCPWPGMDDQYREYHDNEWGIPIADDRELFERVCLEGFQSGLSWITVLRKRNNFRKAFANFDIERVANYGAKDVQKLMGDVGIIRHKGKILATINNAQRAIELIDNQGSLAKYFWSWEPKKVSLIPGSAPAYSRISEALSKDLKSKGWSWVGPTTMYSFMQAVGMVNDHVQTCHAWKTIEYLRNKFDRP
tara:strand:+ start:360 stop:989 length:630 start_codon:yes stop_codon:yes gene_type:complete